MNHIQDILDDLDKTPNTAASATWQRLQIRAICAMAQEVRHISNTMAWGAPGDIPPRIPAEAGAVARELDEALSEVVEGPDRDDATEWEGCTHPEHSCTGCPDEDRCEFPF